MMKPSVTTLTLCTLLLPFTADAASHDVALHELADDVLAVSIPFDAGATMTEITAVKLILRLGDWTPSVWYSPGFPYGGNAPGEDIVYGEIRDGGFSFAYVAYDLSGGFDREVEFDLFYGRDWSELVDGFGIVDLFFELGLPTGCDHTCSPVAPGTLSVGEAILRFEAVSVVGTESASWSAVKATFR